MALPPQFAGHRIGSATAPQTLEVWLDYVTVLTLLNIYNPHLTVSALTLSGYTRDFVMFVNSLNLAPLEVPHMTIWCLYLQLTRLLLIDPYSKSSPTLRPRTLARSSSFSVSRFSPGTPRPPWSMRPPSPSKRWTPPSSSIFPISCLRSRRSKFALVFRIIHSISALTAHIPSTYAHPHRRFFDVPLYNKTRHAVYSELADLASTVGVSRDAVLSLLTVQLGGEFLNAGNRVTDDLKLQIKLGRQNGIHVSPTVVWDGIRDDNVSSGWDLEQWKDWLKSKVHKQ
ncbi:hypothetical protein BC938DRAFT_482862 [Jimgerdemannia flammicorona]|uniref:Thioredoxin-like fold domain-containing protein n=1 Tax=Jimgerdemannia flammicorona TaxID=994334 RepID=A0A433QD19_9FUNG|nr:hypothetical protein BC938DRAFT_482862 [Jimgerdemannia flammicorona]